MGMFDWVVGVPEMKCECGETLSGWQTKDADCQLEKIHFTWIANFYTNCKKCNLWYEFSREGRFEDQDWTIPRPGITLDDFFDISEKRRKDWEEIRHSTPKQ